LYQGGNRAIASLEIFKNMFSCYVQHQVTTILLPIEKMSAGCDPGVVFAIFNFLQNHVTPCGLEGDPGYNH